MNCAAVIVAAGPGRRLGGSVAKVWQPLGGQPMLTWSLQALERSRSCSSMVLVVAPDQLEKATAVLASRPLRKAVALCAGGQERVDSVQAGLAAVRQESELVAIHDAARPLLSPALFDRVAAAAAQTGAAAPVLPLRDTLRRGTGGRAAGWLERRDLYLTQTPQIFKASLLRAAYARLPRRDPLCPAVTDEAQLVEELGQPVQLVPGEPMNFKITDPADLALAERLLGGAPAGGPRCGLGYDVHQLTDGRRLVLGGVEIPHPQGLLGHSDADVLCHAIGDALLGAAGLGDLGGHFPAGDERWRDARSLELLGVIREKLAARGYQPANLDAVLICEAPLIAPHAAAIRDNLASTLGLEADRVSVKATTNETLGFVGRREGIACLATALLTPIPTGPSNYSSEELSQG